MAVTKEKPRLEESGEYTLTIGWVKTLDNNEGITCRFDTNDDHMFFRTLYLSEDYGWEGRMLLGQIIAASGIRFPSEPEDLRGAEFGAEIEIRFSDNYDCPFYNFEHIWRCEA